MFERVKEILRESFLRPKVDDLAEFEKLKEEHPTSFLRLGTLREALAVLTEAEQALATSRPGWFHHRLLQAPGTYHYKLPEWLREMRKAIDHHAQRHDPGAGTCRCPYKSSWSGHNCRAILGPTDEVSKAFFYRHHAGFELWSGRDGWRMAHLEFLSQKLEVMWHKGRLVALKRYHVNRSEWKDQDGWRTLLYRSPPDVL